MKSFLYCLTTERHRASFLRHPFQRQLSNVQSGVQIPCHECGLFAFGAFNSVSGVAHSRSVHFQNMRPLSWALWSLHAIGRQDGQKNKGVAALHTTRLQIPLSQSGQEWRYKHRNAVPAPHVRQGTYPSNDG